VVNHCLEVDLRVMGPGGMVFLTSRKEFLVTVVVEDPLVIGNDLVRGMMTMIMI
jgi:hypothetical protein